MEDYTSNFVITVFGVTTAKIPPANSLIKNEFLDDLRAFLKDYQAKYSDPNEYIVTIDSLTAFPNAHMTYVEEDN